MPFFAFTKELHQDQFSLTERNPKRIFSFMKKDKKAKIVFKACFSASCYRQGTLQAQRVAPPSSFARNYIQHVNIKMSSFFNLIYLFILKYSLFTRLIPVVHQSDFILYIYIYTHTHTHTYTHIHIHTILFIYFFKFYFIFKLYIIVLVLPNIKMHPPQVYMCSPS